MTDAAFAELVTSWVEDFKKDEISRDIFCDVSERVLKVRVGFLYDGNRKRGYQLMFLDDTAHQQYLKTITEYNKKLRMEIEYKNKKIKELDQRKGIKNPTERRGNIPMSVYPYEPPKNQ